MKILLSFLLFLASSMITIQAAIVMPSSGPTAGGINMVITASGGDDFEAQGAMSSILLGTIPVITITSWSASSIQFQMPQGIGAGLQVKVTTQSGVMIICSNLFSYSAPVMFNVSPSTGPAVGGTAVAVIGDNFGPMGTPATVTIGGVPATSVTVSSHTSLSFVSPAGTGTNKEVVVTVGGQSNSVIPYWSYHPPIVYTSSPGSGPTSGGTLVSLTGDNFGPPGTIASVTVGGAPGTSVTVTSDSTLTFLTPEGTGSNKSVVVTVAAQSSAPAPLWSYDPPVASLPFPSSGPTAGGTMVTLTGLNFGPPGTPASVTIDGASCTEVAVTGHTILTFKTPAGAGINQNIIVSIAGQSSAPAPLWNYAAPVVYNIAPTNGPTPGGTLVEVMGNNFGTPGTPATLTIDGIPATNVIVTGHTTLSFVSPPGSGLNNAIVVTIEGQQSTPLPLWSYNPPIVYSSTPQIGPTTGATFVTLSGDNFGPPGTLATVMIDGAPGTSAVVLGHTLLTFNTPAGAGLNQPVVVNIDGQAGVPAEIWDYAPPVLFGLSPATGPTIGGTIVSATGINFGPPGSIIGVTVDGISSPMVTYIGHSALSFVTPAGTGAQNPVVITVEGQVSNSYNFSYGAPTVTSLDPNYGTENGGTLVRMIGENFGPQAPPLSVMIDSVPVQNLMHSNDTLITFTTPPGMGSGLPVQITIDGQQVIPPPTFSYHVPEGVGIGTLNPHESAALDITSDSKGILIPRLTTTQREAIGSPVAGLLVYDSTLNAFFFFNGTIWKQLSMQ